MEEISGGGDTTKNTMASLGILCEKDIDEQRLQIDSFIASPFQRSMDSVLARAKATAQSQGLGRITVIQSQIVNCKSLALLL